MIETASWPPKCATDSSGRRAQDSRPAPAASASPLPDQAIRSRPARPRGLRNSGPRARPPQPWRLDRQAFCAIMWMEDFHLQAVVRTRHTKKAPGESGLRGTFDERSRAQGALVLLSQKVAADGKENH